MIRASRWLVLVALSVVVVFAASCQREQPAAPSGTGGEETSTPPAGGQEQPAQTGGEQAGASQDIVAVAVAQKNFTTLVSLVKEAGLADALKGPGPFTVFAPTDAAFSKVPADTLASLKADKAKLKNVLLYHVVKGKKMAADLKNGMTLQTMDDDQTLTVKIEGGKVMVDGATVVTPDVAASNGVIHVIDAVMMPPEKAPEQEAPKAPAPSKPPAEEGGA